MKESKKFVILATPRTGSNMLVSALNSHPQINCHGELFRKNISSQPIGSVKVINLVRKQFGDEKYRYNHPIEFLDDVIAASNNSAYTGFKLMLRQHRALVEELIKSDDYKKILLERSNLLAVYSSAKIAKITGQGDARRSATIRRAKIKFDVESFEKFCLRREKRYRNVKKLLNRAGQKFHKIEYNDLRTIKGLRKVLDFLEVDANEKLSIETRKRNNDSIIERFSNPEFVNDYLKNKELDDWCTERITSF